MLSGYVLGQVFYCCAPGCKPEVGDMLNPFAAKDMHDRAARSRARIGSLFAGGYSVRLGSGDRAIQNSRAVRRWCSSRAVRESLGMDGGRQPESGGAAVKRLKAGGSPLSQRWFRQLKGGDTILLRRSKKLT